MSVNALMTRFPDVDAVTIEETLALCNGSEDECAALLTDVLAEEAASKRPTALRTLLDGVSLLAMLPPERQPDEQRASVLRLCATLEQNGINLTRPVQQVSRC